MSNQTRLDKQHRRAETMLDFILITIIFAVVAACKWLLVPWLFGLPTRLHWCR